MAGRLAVSLSVATYIGWAGRDGRPVVSVLRGAVVSPLAPSPDEAFDWADCGAGAHGLGEAILADAMGPAGGDHVESFVKEIIDRLPHDGFELSSTDVVNWLRRQDLSDR